MTPGHNPRERLRRDRSGGPCCSCPARSGRPDACHLPFMLDAKGVQIRRPLAEVVAPVAVVSMQPTNAKRPRRENGKGTWQFSLMLMDGRGDDLCLPCWR